LPNSVSDRIKSRIVQFTIVNNQMFLAVSMASKEVFSKPIGVVALGRGWNKNNALYFMKYLLVGCMVPMLILGDACKYCW
jgi:hypothetical protein